MDDPKVAEVARLITLRDKWLIAYGKLTTDQDQNEKSSRN